MRPRVRYSLFFLDLLVVSLLPLQAEPEFSSVMQPSRTAIPDLTQTDPRGNFPAGGVTYCGPVAVSNSLWALFGKEYEARETFTQFDLVHELASQPFMNIDVSYAEIGHGHRRIFVHNQFSHVQNTPGQLIHRSQNRVKH